MRIRSVAEGNTWATCLNDNLALLAKVSKQYVSAGNSFKYSLAVHLNGDSKGLAVPGLDFQITLPEGVSPSHVRIKPAFGAGNTPVINSTDSTITWTNATLTGDKHIISFTGRLARGMATGTELPIVANIQQTAIAGTLYCGPRPPLETWVRDYGSSLETGLYPAVLGFEF